MTSEGKVAVALSSAHDISIHELAVRYRVEKTWWDASSLDTPKASREGDTVSVVWGAKESSPLSQIQARFQVGQVEQLRLQLFVTPRQAGVKLTGFVVRIPQGQWSFPKVESKLYWLHHGHQSWSFSGAVLLEAPFLSPALEDEDLLAKASKGDPVDETKGLSWWFGMASATP